MAYLRDPYETGDPYNPYYQEPLQGGQNPYQTGIENQQAQEQPRPDGDPSPAPTSNTSPFDRTAFRDAWMASGTDVNRQNDLLNQYGIKLDQAGRGRLPSGDYLDLRYGAKAGINRASWTPVFDPEQPNAMPGGGGGGVGGSMTAPTQFGGGYGYGAGSYGMGEDSFSQAANQSLMDLLAGKGPGSKLYSTLEDSLISRLHGGNDPTNARLESAREGIDRARKSQLNNLQGILADRGLLSEGGISQGPEQSSYSRLEDNLAGQYATTLRDIYADQADRERDLFGVAGSIAGQRDQTALGAVGALTGRQNVIARIALDSLAQNQDWQRFLAQHGLDQQRFAYDVQMGNTAQYLQLIQLYLQGAQQSAQGYD